jgi:SSS family solute:Na+ symporter
VTFGIVLGYLGLLLFLGVFAGRLLSRSAGDYFLASRGIGPFMLLMSVFGTTMTAFALIGSTGKTFEKGIGVYGLMASWSGIIHSVIFFLIGARVWALGKKHGYVTQLSFFRDRYQSNALALCLFPLMVCFVILYILMGVIGAGRVLQGITPETFAMADHETRVELAALPSDLKLPPDWSERVRHDGGSGELVITGSVAPKRRVLLLKASAEPVWKATVGALFTERRLPTGAVPYEAGMALVCFVVLFYVFFGGMRATAWANTIQTLVFMVMGVVCFVVIKTQLGGAAAATENLAHHIDPEATLRMGREGLIGKTQFLTYCFIPLSVGMFPHLFQHWLTARRASSFKLTVVAHPLCILITWLPCVLLGMWASGVLPLTTPPNIVLPTMVSRYSNDILSGLIGAGILAAIMSSMDSQFLCLGSIFTNDIVVHHFGKERFSDRARILMGRGFVVAIVVICYCIALLNHQSVFDLGVWCFTGFASLFPLVLAALYWRRSNAAGAIASVLTVGILWLVFLPNVLQGEEFLIAGAMPVTLILAASSAVLVIVTLMTRPPEPALVEKFFGEGAGGAR